MDVREKLKMCLDTLMEIQGSGYWPFASPAPCSTEVQIKRSIEKAIDDVDTALYWHDKEFGRGRDCMTAPSFKIVELK
jgi:hypothetical protein